MSDEQQTAVATQDEEIKRGAFAEVPLEAIRRSTTNPRKRFDEAALKDLTESIRTKGLVQPILVRPVPEKDGVLFELVAGERRFRACTALKMDTVGCFIRALTDQQALELQIIENLQRDDLDPLEEAEGYQKLLELGEMDAKAIAARIDKSLRYVYARMKLLALPKAAREALLSGRLGTRAAVEIASLPHADLRDEAVRIVLDPRGCKIPEIVSDHYEKEKGEAMTLRETVELIGERYMRSVKSAPFDLNDGTLNPAMGPCTTCPRLAGNSPDQFPDLRGDMCTDMKCFATKRAAFEKRLVAEAETKGMKVLPAEQAKKFIYSNGEKVTTNYNSPYATLDEAPSYSERAPNSKEIKYRALLKGLEVPIVLAIDERTGKPVELVDRKMANAAAKKAKPDYFRSRETSAGSAAEKKEAEKTKREEAIAAVMFEDVVDAIVLKIEKTEKPSEGLAKAFLEYAIQFSGDFFGCGDDETPWARVLKRRRFEWSGDLPTAMRAYIKSLNTTPSHVLAFAVELLMTYDDADGNTGIDFWLVKEFKIDREKIKADAKAVVAEREKEAAELAAANAKGALSKGITAALTAAGKSGLNVKQLAEKLKVKPNTIFSWFYTTGKKDLAFSKVGEATYAMSSFWADEVKGKPAAAKPAKKAARKAVAA